MKSLNSMETATKLLGQLKEAGARFKDEPHTIAIISECLGAYGTIAYDNGIEYAQSMLKALNMTPIPGNEDVADAYDVPQYVELLTYRGNKFCVPVGADVIVEERDHKDTDVAPDKIKVAIIYHNGREYITRLPYLKCLAMLQIISPEAAGMTDEEAAEAGLKHDLVEMPTT